MGAGRPGSVPGPPLGEELAAGGGGGLRVRRQLPSPSPPRPQSPSPRPHRAPPLRAVPAAGSSGAATKLKAATCCICAATAATGPKPGPCAAARRAAWCCRIFGREEGRAGVEGPAAGSCPGSRTPTWPTRLRTTPAGPRHLPLWCRLRRPRAAVAPGERRPTGPPSAASAAAHAPDPYPPA